MQTTSKTFHGRSLEAVLPQISSELGEDAIVLRCREGLRGGILGFFRRPCVEIEATARPARVPGEERDEVAAAAAVARLDATMSLADVPALEVRSDRATAEGMISPAVQLLIEQAAPFADRLRSAQGQTTLVADGASDLASAGLSDPKLYGPQPTAVPATATAAKRSLGFAGSGPLPAPSKRAADPFDNHDFVADAIDPSDGFGPSGHVDRLQAPPAPAAAGPELPTAARTAESRLVFCGMDPVLAADIVGEAVVHGLPFGSPRGLKKVVRSTLAQRLQTLGHRGRGPLTVAVAGPAGAGTSTVVSHLAAAYAAAAQLPVVVIAVRSADAGARLHDRLGGLGVRVEAAADGAQARAIAAQHPDAMIFVDLPSVSLAGDAEDAALAADLGALKPDELHLALPATTSSASAEEFAALLDPLGLTHIALTQMDETRRPGAGLGFCIASGRALSYLSVRGSIAPADAAAVAQLLLP